MSTWRSVPSGITEKAAHVEKQKAMSEPYSDIWEEEKLSCWSGALMIKGTDIVEYLPGISRNARDDQTGMDPIENDEAGGSGNVRSVVKTIGRLFGLA
ncbi:hypothetical protein RSOLAG1IB_06470 [Rhizoctonia solani AG-1 IB]|uniref:Uncharacterized protein n=1 Tax=Thanatephorus cucumeris (strain AG1-IB / isolate 7/3/14) TaxID=1108050 RepID=A0A0B7F7V7_THACB|nr:hypothetical protein RSOLAG1IB_06470 [Rhizoctonia solani AG-1 IB]